MVVGNETLKSSSHSALTNMKLCILNKINSYIKQFLVQIDQSGMKLD